jgi:hypothetical protein
MRRLLRPPTRAYRGLLASVLRTFHGSSFGSIKKLDCAAEAKDLALSEHCPVTGEGHPMI